MSKLIVIAHDIRSCHNVGSLLRTADGLGIDRIYLTGYTPYPQIAGDTRLPHISARLTRTIHKTALGAETSMPWSHHDDIRSLVGELQSEGYEIAALEQTAGSISLSDYKPTQKVALLLGREVEGLADELLSMADSTIEIPMHGAKESFNVIEAAAMAMYHIRLLS